MTAHYRRYYRVFAWFFRIVYRIRVIGSENEPPESEGGFLVCANHMSATDPIKVCYAFKRHQVCFMAKKELFRIPVFSSLIKGLGAYPIDRGRNDVAAIRHTFRLLERGECAGMFPQGTRCPEKDPRTTAVKPGAGMIAEKNNSDVIPVFIYTKNLKHRIFRKTYVVIGKPVKFSEFGYEKGVAGEYLRVSKEIFGEICRLGAENGFLGNE